MEKHARVFLIRNVAIKNLIAVLKLSNLFLFVSEKLAVMVFLVVEILNKPSYFACRLKYVMAGYLTLDPGREARLQKFTVKIPIRQGRNENIEAAVYHVLLKLR